MRRLASSLLLARLAAAQTVSLAPAPKASNAAGISDVVDSSFAGFGFEPSNLFSFTGTTSPNGLSVNLLQNLADYAGAPAAMRIGGNTADYMIYDADYSGWSLKQNPDPQGQGAIPSDSFTYGPNYFKALDRFPKGTEITFGLNLAYEGDDYLQNIVNEARAAVSLLKNVRLVSFEVGNEPDLYLKNGFRDAPWGGQVYTQQFLERASAVYERVLRPAGLSATFFEPPATASTIGTTFEIEQLVKDGILAGVNGSTSLVAGWNQHDYYYFVDVSTYALTLDHMLQLPTTADQFAYWASQVKIALSTGLPYYLREMASAGPVGLQGISDTFGAALWTLNFFLYAASLSIAAVQMHMTDNSFASAWQPGTMYGKGPHVRPSYAAFAAMAQLLGACNGSAQIAPLTLGGVPAGYAGYVGAWAGYASGALQALVLLNTRASNASAPSGGTLPFSLALPGLEGQTLYISRLSAPGADSTEGVSWNGLSFETSDGTPKKLDKDDSASTVKVDSNGNAATWDARAGGG
ncbi:hypothetical protein EJ06DRAFT_537316 [Trichodelitschia bisporula]|uniref:Beta-glucuronidase C-terminal domain-containing protein n=1 Tax=Trichodelitschia bisporula TaxID=703511 RepID=A0A6G1HZ62_9PEZI|nr:hypothetical protein EJ06DRAFT_537316 [Trichodelitschia bisporula]